MWLNPFSFSRGRRGGRSFMTQDNLKPQLGTCPSSPPPPPPLNFNFKRKESPGLFLWSCLHTSRLCKESRQPSSSSPLTDESCVCIVITIRNVRPFCFAPPRSHTAPFSSQRSPSGRLSTVATTLNPQRNETTRKKKI